MLEPGTRVDIILDGYGCTSNVNPTVSANSVSQTPAEAGPTHGHGARRPALARATQRHRRAAAWAHRCGLGGASCGNEGRLGDWECTHSRDFYSGTARRDHSDESGSGSRPGHSGIQERGAHTVAHGLPPSQRVRAARLQSWSAKGSHRSTVNSQQSTADSQQQGRQASSPTRPIRTAPVRAIADGASRQEEVHEGNHSPRGPGA